MTDKPTIEGNNKPPEPSEQARRVFPHFTHADSVKGGKTKTPRKAAAARVNALKNGSRIRQDSPNIKALGLDNSAQKIAAPAVVERIKWLKEHYPAFYATSPEQSAEGIQKFFEDSLMEVLRLKSEGKNINQQLRDLGKDFILLHEMRFGKLNLNKNININLTEFQQDYELYRDSVIMVLKKHPGMLQAVRQEYERRKATK
jgi:vacuolar-type H+-ATPase subunit I/STV1